MATRRIKDITNTATTFASDDFIALDGATQGTRKMDKDDLIAEVSAGVSGDYLEEANNLSDVASLDTSKLNMEIPDVGTAPNEVPLNGQLGTMAFQDSAGISVGEVEASNLTVEAASASTDPILTTQAISGASTITGLQVTAAGAVTMSQNLDLTGDEKAIKFHSWESGNQIERALIKADGDPSGAGFGGSLVIQTSDDGTFAERMRVDPQGRVGIGTSSPGSFALGANELVVGDGAAGRGITVYGSTGGSLYFANGTSGTAKERGFIYYNHAADEMRFGTAADTRWTINSTGNLVAGSGLGIDFGSGATLDEYEVGTWTPAYTTTSSGFTNPPTMDVISARYVRIGDLVTFDCHIRTDSVDLTGAGTYLLVNGLPYAAAASSGTNSVAVNVGYATAWANAPAGAYVQSGQTYMYLTKRVTSITGNLSEMSPSDLTAGVAANQNILMLSGSYYTNA